MRWHGCFHGFKLRRKVAQKRRFVAQLHSLNLFALLPNCKDDFHHIVNVALGVNTTRDGKTNQVHRRRCSEHQRANLNRTNSAFEIKFVGQRDARETVRRNLWQEGTRINVNRVASGRLHDRHAMLGDVVPKIGGGSDAVFEVVLVKSLLYADRDGLQIAPRETAVSRIALG